MELTNYDKKSFWFGKPRKNLSPGGEAKKKKKSFFKVKRKKRQKTQNISQNYYEQNKMILKALIFHTV